MFSFFGIRLYIDFYKVEFPIKDVSEIEIQYLFQG